MTVHRTWRLHLEVADGQRGSWVVPLLADVAVERGWSVDEDGADRPDAVALVRPVGGAVVTTDEPAFVVAVEAGTPRSPVVVESADHLVPRFDLVLGEFKARRNQEVTRAAIDRFLVRVEQDRPRDAPAAEPAAPDAVVGQARVLLAAVDAWLARTTMTPDAARAVHADRAILDAAIGAPEVDLVIVERAAARLALRLEQ
ncbi:hypothetical protein ACE2AJ_12525 [Aquihabitans daechungensis]|uniref:hypothetical protein n=1 Tax=Aquihabitans daechungensis TaxID=1052257 RepID=UPI003BA37A9A